ncbi:MAG TPA: oligoendopeptidase F [Bacillota bacterium]|nr:oligoendopeptidase F [Bacillota bacterium]
MTEAKKGGVPFRQEIPQEFKWDLESVYATDEEWERDFAAVKELAEKIKGYSGRLGVSAGTLLECLKLRDEIMVLGSQVIVFANLRRDEDTSNAKHQGMADRAGSLGVVLNTAVSFIEPELLGLEDGVVSGFLKEEPGLDEYRHYLDNVLRQKPHTLSPREEQLLAMAGELDDAPYNIFSMLNNADMRFPEIRDEEGEKVELSHGRYIKFMQSPDRRVRREAYEAMYTTYGNVINTLATSLNSKIKGGMFFARARNFASAREAALFTDNIPVSVYDNVVDTINANLEPLHRYVSLKKRVLGLEKIAMHDIYAPLVSEVKMEVPFAKAREMVLAALAPLGEEYVRDASKAFTEGWIDVYENKGKRSGAYSWGSYSTKPFMLLNYDDTLNAASTLAHELGHSMHSYYSKTNLPPSTAQYPIFLAEVASTLNEALLNDYLLKTTEDKQKRLYIINEYLETIRGTVYRQTLFAEFEKEIYARSEAGQSLTNEDFSNLWLELNKKYYGPEMEVDDLIGLEWARIPHFYYNFYVYKYVTGFAAATCLAQNVLAGDEEATKRYLQFLKSGGSDYPLNILKTAGVDMTEPKPLVTTLEVFSKLLAELEELL